MSSLSPLKSPHVKSWKTDSTRLESTVARLRAEYEARSEGPSRAILLHEIAILEERLGDEPVSARHQLGAVNAEPEFHEPLERLIAVIERRQSYKNLGRLLERLIQVAEQPRERIRALFDGALHLLEHEADASGARSLLELASKESPGDPSLWLALDLVAGRLGDLELRERTLLARASLTTHPLWKALLLMSVAEQRAAADEVEGAERALEEAAAVQSALHFSALCAIAELSRRHAVWAMGMRAHDRIAEAILESVRDKARGDALGVPHYRRSLAHAADAWLCAAEMARVRGDWSAAVDFIERGLEVLPADPMLLRARFHSADIAGDVAAAARLAQAGLERGMAGPAAAALLLRVAEARASESDAAGTLLAVSDALRADPESLAARALQLDLLSTGDDPQAFASALEATADQLPTDAAKARFYLLSADVWARQCRDAQGARAALSQAALFGTAPATVARFARLLAALTEDPAWYEEATRRLIAQGATHAEQAGLWFELVRARGLRGERSAVNQALVGLSAAPGGEWLGNVLSAYALDALPKRSDAEQSLHRKPTSDAEATAPALYALAALESDPATAHALRLILAFRALLAGQASAARKVLEQLHADAPKNLVVARALCTLEKAHASPGRAAHVLLRAATATDDSALRVALKLEAGVLVFRAGDRNAALSLFDSAGEPAQARRALYGWALLATEATDVQAQRQMLGAASEFWPDLAALHRFALEASRGQDKSAALEALNVALDHPESELRDASLLARALWGEGPGADDDRARALSSLAENTGSFGLCRGVSYGIQLARAEQGENDDALADAAQSWAEADPAITPTLEWLFATTQARDVAGEIEARLALARRLPATLGLVFEASAALVSWLAGEGERSPLDAAVPAAKLANLELAGPGSDPRRRAHALLDVGLSLGDESVGVLTALAGYNQLAYGDASGALHSFRQVVDAHPDDLMGWEGLRAAAEAVADRAALAEACAALGDAVSDDAAGGAFWEQAALILIDEFDDRARGEFALSRAVDRDIRRFESFDRLFRLVRERKDGPRLLELVARRLEVAEDAAEIAKLFWERARVLRSSGDREAALAALENVRLLEGDHVGALALSGEIYITLGRFAEAAENLARLGRLEAAPTQQRLMSAIAAVDLYEHKLDDPHSALEVLENLVRAGLGTLPVRERLARAAARSGAWSQATDALEFLMNERDTAAGRVEAARLALVIYRDRLQQTERATEVTARLLAELPDDGEALDLVLQNALPRAASIPILERGVEHLTARLALEPIDPERVERLARMAAYLEKAALRQAALGALITLGISSEAVEQELVRLDQRVAHVPRIAIDDGALPALADPEDHGPIGELMRTLALTIGEQLGPGLASFGVGKRERVDARLGLPLRNEIAAWAGALGVGEFELYIGGSDPDQVVAISGDVPALLVGAAVMAPLGPRHRQAVARELFALRRGTTVLRHRESAEIAALIVAACRLGEIELPSPAYGMLSEFQRLLGKAPRKVRKQLPELARAVEHSGHTPIGWTRAAVSTLDRMAAIAAGDVSWVLADRGRERGVLALSGEARTRATRLLSFVLSPGYLELRGQLGMDVR